MAKKGREEVTGPGPRPSRWTDYVWANAAMFAFLFVLLYAVRSACIEPGDDQTPAIPIIVDQTLKFFGFLMGGGFLVVTLFDAAYEFFAGKAEEPSGPDQAPPA